MKQFDLNADLGEGMPGDAALFDIISSASIACGGHAGDETTMRLALRAARARGVAVGAHPGFADREHFGRRRLLLPPEELDEQVRAQVRALVEFAEEEEVPVRYLKLHGALANMAAEEPAVAALCFASVTGLVPGLAVLAIDDSAQVEVAEALGHVESLQPPFSAIQRGAGADLIPWCAQNGTGVIVYSPMQSGLLSGGFSVERAQALRADDWRSRNAEFQPPCLARNLALAEALKPIAERHGTTQAAVAIAWTLAWPGVTGAIVGMRNVAQVDGVLGAAELELDSDDMARIADAIELTGAGVGPLRPVDDSGALPANLLR